MRPGIRWRWTRNGAVAGVLVAVSDLTEWRGPKYLPWEGDGIAYNLSMVGGYLLGGILLFLVAALARQAFTKDP